MSGALQQALELVRKAIEQDQSGNYAEAHTSYTASILLFTRALAEDTSNNPQFQKLIMDKVNEYQQRATVIQQYLQADAAPQGPAATTSPATSAAPRSSSFAPATYNPVASPASPPAYSSAPAPALAPYSSPASSPPTQPSLRPPTSAGYQPLPPAYGEGPAPAAGSPPTYPSAAPRSSPAPTPALQPHLHFNWFYADRSVSAFVRKWQFSWDSHREKFDVLERRNPYLRSSFSLLGSEGAEKYTIELKDHKVQRFSESASQWEEPMSIGTELRVAFTTDKHAQFIACLPEYKHMLGAEGIDRQWQAWAQTWLGVDVSREHRLVDEADVETEVERHMTHWGKQAVKLKKTVPLESSVIVFEAIVEWATLRPHTAAFTVCSLGRDQQATMEKQFFVFEWPDAPSGRSSELTTAVEEWDAEFDKEVRKYMEELRENMGQPNARPEPSPRAAFPDPGQRSFNASNNGNEYEEEDDDEEEEEDLSARMRALHHDPQQGQARRVVHQDYAQARPELHGVPATAPGPAFAQRQPGASSSSSSSLGVAPAPSASEVPQQHYRQPPAGQDVSNTILLGELSLLRQEMTLLKEVYITEILALKSMVQTLLQAQTGSGGSTNPSTARMHPAQPGGPRT